MSGSGTPDSARPDGSGTPDSALQPVPPPSRRIRLELLAVSDRLTEEFRDQLSAGSVSRCVASCCLDLRGSGLREGLPEMVERLARQRLADRAA